MSFHRITSVRLHTKEIMTKWKGSVHTSRRILEGEGRIETQEVGFGAIEAGARAAHDVAKGELVMLGRRAEVEVLGAEEEEGVEQHDGGVGPQLLTAPQVLLLHPRVDVACVGVGWG